MTLLVKPQPLSVNARLFMFTSVWGWSALSFVLQVFITCTNSASASGHRPWLPYADRSGMEETSDYFGECIVDRVLCERVFVQKDSRSIFI
ncbi:hypothetical protein DM02DRAFT_343867 [Periconia macrospinosa]|uniref:Uncharacterized protein n=1 Tax=Periconia macrospinosa TaxID=97972 RepID=A0A2V1D043_9PLEO|nr:hypothetical protein DM02DRAFT_343867 [Periconia macrospinosa]